MCSCRRTVKQDLDENLHQGIENTFLLLKTNVGFPEGDIHAPSPSSIISHPCDWHLDNTVANERVHHKVAKVGSGKAFSRTGSPASDAKILMGILCRLRYMSSQNDRPKLRPVECNQCLPSERMDWNQPHSLKVD
jgi:hypothetical protein